MRACTHACVLQKIPGEVWPGYITDHIMMMVVADGGFSTIMCHILLSLLAYCACVFVYFVWQIVPASLSWVLSNPIKTFCHSHAHAHRVSFSFTKFTLAHTLLCTFHVCLFCTGRAQQRCPPIFHPNPPHSPHPPGTTDVDLLMRSARALAGGRLVTAVRNLSHMFARIMNRRSGIVGVVIIVDLATLIKKRRQWMCACVCVCVCVRPASERHEKHA